ncbi:MAG: MATE family efflux transporter [Tepidisphaerales bacterium]
MSAESPPSATLTLPTPRPASAPRERLFRALLLLALPVLAENTLNILVGLTDAYLANHLPEDIRVDATAAVGTVTYLMWFLGLFATAIGTGATAIIARATGARHRGRAHAAAGQALLLAAVAGVLLGMVFFSLAYPIAHVAGLSERPASLAAQYLRIFAPCVPAMLLLMVANACLRGAGDTRTPAAAMILVNLLNIALSVTLTYGYLGLPALGFRGIVLGTTLAYAVGAVLQLTVLLSGWGRLHVRLPRLRFHPPEMGRLLRVGLPAGAEQCLNWGVNFFLVHVVNQLGPVSSAAHFNTIRIESLSYTTGFAVGIATSTMVGQSLGMRDVGRARRSVRYGLMLGAGTMAFLGLTFVLLSGGYAAAMSADPAVTQLTSECLFIAGFVQFGFGAYIIFAAALRGAGDTRGAMMVNLLSICGFRLVGVWLVGVYFKLDLAAVWIVLSAELMLRGLFMYARYASGKWETVRV